jgi:HpcH/HpaI aldolase/citrate lyase family
MPISDRLVRCQFNSPRLGAGMNTPQNSFKGRLLAGDLQIGLWSSLCSNIAAEIIGDSGFDWILLDTEHAPNELPGVLAQLQVLGTGTAQAVVRPAWNDAVLIKRLLDIGAQTLLIPFVQSAEEARRAVAACRYPPPLASAELRWRACQPLRLCSTLSSRGRWSSLRAYSGRNPGGDQPYP